MDFITNFSTTIFDDWVIPPSGTRLKQVMDIYARLGIPGTIGSMDVTHVRWDRCPVYERHMHVGKEGYPTLAFQVVVDHSRLIHAVSRAFKGACNDQTIARNDEFPMMKLFAGKYKDVKSLFYLTKMELQGNVKVGILLQMAGINNFQFTFSLSQFQHNFTCIIL